MRALLPPFLLFLLSGLGAALIRYRMVEPTDLAHACMASPSAGICPLRQWLVLSFSWQQPGWLAAACGLTALLLASLGAPAGRPTGQTSSGSARVAKVLALMALAFGAAGLLLYSFDPAAVGSLLGVVALSRLAERHGVAAR